VNQAIIDPACDNLFPGEVSPQPISFFPSTRISKKTLNIQILCLGLVGQDCTTVHVVQTDESCDAITIQANITFADLRTDNPNIDADCTNIVVGEVRSFSNFYFKTFPFFGFKA